MVGARRFYSIGLCANIVIGLVSVDGYTVSTLQDYKNFKSQLASVTPSGTQSAQFSPTYTRANCPTSGSSWSVSGGPLPTAPVVAAAVNNGGGETGSSTGNSGNSSAGNDSTSSGLSSGAKAGIGVGVGVGAALVLAIAGFLFWRRRRSSKKEPWPESQNEKVETDEDPAAMLHAEDRAHEMEQPKSEMPADRERLEMEARHGKSEMGRSTSSAVGKTGIEGRHELAGSEQA